MALLSAGLLMCGYNTPAFFLVHPGGPLYAKKDDGAWSIPKGLAEPQEDLLLAARREFLEETGMTARGPFTPLDTTKLKSGKTVFAWAFRGKWNPNDGIYSNTFSMEWPPRSKIMITVPEADKAAWFDAETAVRKIHPAQVVFVERALKLMY